MLVLPGVCLGPRDLEAHRRDVVLVLRAVLAHAVDPRAEAGARPRHELLQLLPHPVDPLPEVTHNEEALLAIHIYPLKGSTLLSTEN